MHKNKHYIFLGFTLLIAIAFVAWRYQNQMTKVPPAHIVILLDRSVSTSDRCSSLLGLSKQAFSSPNIRRGSTINILGTGDFETTNEPVLIASYEIPKSNKILEGKGKAKIAREKVFADILKQCKGIKETNHSPIFLAVKRSIEQLKALACTDKSKCRLLIQTDGQETSEPWLKKALKSQKALKTKPPVKINNKGIQVVFCGLSETKIKQKTRTVKQTERLNTAWKAGFTNPALVVFQPFCPKYQLENEER